MCGVYRPLLSYGFTTQRVHKAYPFRKRGLSQRDTAHLGKLSCAQQMQQLLNSVIGAVYAVHRIRVDPGGRPRCHPLLAKYVPLLDVVDGFVVQSIRRYDTGLCVS